MSKKRSSTVERVGISLFLQILEYCEMHNCGFILRLWGHEIAVRYYDGVLRCETPDGPGKAFGEIFSDFKNCLYIRKGAF